MASTKGLVRQEGFHPDNSNSNNSASNNNGSNTSNNNVGWRPTSGMNGMIGNDDDLLVGEGNGGFDQELVTLMSSERSTASSTASTGPTASSSISSSASSATTTTGTTNDYVHRTHNIFDMGITVRPPSSSQTQSQSPSLPHSQTHNLSQSPPLPSIPTHFNSTLPALNSSMRYEPLPDSPNANNSASNTNNGGNSSMTPTGESPGLSHTTHNHTPVWGGVTRHTPSPHPHAGESGYDWRIHTTYTRISARPSTFPEPTAKHAFPAFLPRIRQSLSERIQSPSPP
ncbi:hypothetical protein F5880DRAFT_772275 [Lentinula raphanica]|nr:hypothetical protein F5880DRAFT_772275 [Lentinula raphanica]